MNKLLTLSLMVALSIALPACGGGGSGGSSDEGTSNSTPSQVTPESNSVQNIDDEDDVVIEKVSVYDNYIDDPFSKDSNKLEARFKLPENSNVSIVTNARHGSLEVINDEIIYKFAPENNIALTTSDDERTMCEKYLKLSKDSFMYRIEDKETGEITNKLQEVKFYVDPLLKYQWHLCNYGQNSVTGIDTNIVRGNDINVFPAWLKGANGEGVDTYVIDSDFDMDHEDLDFGSYNAVFQYLLESAAHGTAVSGIIGAKANSKGGRGVAYNTKLNVYAGLSNVTGYLKNIFYHKLINSENVLVSPINMSFSSLIPVTKNTFNSDYENLYYVNLLPVTAASNTHNLKSLSTSYAYNIRSLYDSSECLLNNTNCFYPHGADILRNPHAIIVGAVNADGSRSSYSMTGSNLWVSAFGGEARSGTHQILTTDLPTCDRGYSYSKITKYDSNFEKGLSFLNRECNYTAQMNGTSSATPMVTGAVADLVSARNDLSINQIKYILAKTANIYHSSETFSAGASFGWQVNSANVSFSTEYGFGVIDVGAAVDYALNECDYDLNCLNRKQVPDVEFETGVKAINCKETHNEHEALLGSSSYTYECEINMPSEEFSGFSAQIENLGVQFEDVKIKPQSTNKGCAVANTFRDFPKLVSQSDAPYEEKQQAAKNLRNLVVGVSTNDNREIYLVKSRNENFFGYDDSALLTQDKMYALVNGVYQEDMPYDGKVKVYFGSECPLEFSDDSVSISLSAYSSL